MLNTAGKENLYLQCLLLKIPQNSLIIVRKIIKDYKTDRLQHNLLADEWRDCQLNIILRTYRKAMVPTWQLI